MKRVFTLPIRALQGFVESIFNLMKLLLCCPCVFWPGVTGHSGGT